MRTKLRPIILTLIFFLSIYTFQQILLPNVKASICCLDASDNYICVTGNSCLPPYVGECSCTDVPTCPECGCSLPDGDVECPTGTLQLGTCAVNVVQKNARINTNQII